VSIESTRLAVGAGVAFVLLEFDVPLEMLLARNASRQSDLPVEVPDENVARI
jgi:predicted kinase